MAGVERTRPESTGTPAESLSSPISTGSGERSTRSARLTAILATSFCLGILIAFVGVGTLVSRAQAGQDLVPSAGSTDAESLAIRRLSTVTREQRDTVARLTTIQRSLTEEANRLDGALRSVTAERDAARLELERSAAASESDVARQQGVGVRLRALETRVAALQHERAAAQGHADRLQSRIVALERSLVTAYAQREVSTHRLRDWVVEQSRAIERILAKAGVDLESLLERADDSSEGVGGPLRPAEDVEPTVALGTGEPALRRVMASLPLAEPMSDYRIMSPFGRRRDPINGRRAMHEGIDLSGNRGERIRATQAGTVIHAGREGAYGISVVLDHGMGITTRCAHLKSVLVRKGQKVRQGQMLGVIGNTGRSTGRHLHYEIRLDDRPLDPLPFIEAGKQRVLAARN